MSLPDVKTPFSHILLLLQQDVCVQRYQRYSMRRFTVWIKRSSPSYFQRFPGYNQGFDTEVQSWRNWINQFPSLSVISIFPATDWVHMTLEVHGRHILPYDRSKDGDVMWVKDIHPPLTKGASWVLSQF